MKNKKTFQFVSRAIILVFLLLFCPIASSATDGTQKRAKETTGKVRSSPAIGADGTIYVGSYDNKLYAINPDGTLKWAFETENYVHSSPAIGGDGTIYVGSDDKHLYAIYGSSGGLADTPWPMFHHNVRRTGLQEKAFPTADAGPDQTVNEGDTVTLDGSNSSDLDDGIASYLWDQTGGTPVPLSDPTAVQPTFTAPDVDY